LREILPVLTPIRLSDAHALPTLSNLRLHMIVRLTSSDPKETGRIAVVEIPANLHRTIFLPAEKGLPFVLLEDVIGAFAADLFHGYQIEEKGLFRLTRGAEMTLDEEKDEDFAKVMAEAVRRRRAGEVTRLQ
jgi:polyphosphate kinase